MTHTTYKLQEIDGVLYEVHARPAKISPHEPNFSVRDLNGRLYVKVEGVGKQQNITAHWHASPEPEIRGRSLASHKTDAQMAGSSPVPPGSY